MVHTEMIRTITRLVRDGGPAVALDALRITRPALGPVSAADDGYHDTLAVFFVWAVDRLVEAGLTDTGVVWHPLTDARSPLSWWDEATLATPAARTGFVASTLAADWEPAPADPTRLVAVRR